MTTSVPTQTHTLRTPHGTITLRRIMAWSDRGQPATWGSGQERRPAWEAVQGSSYNHVWTAAEAVAIARKLLASRKQEAGRRAAHDLWNHWLDQLFAAAASARDMAALLRLPAGRAQVAKCQRAGKAYSADAEQYARRPVVRAAVQFLAARQQRRLDRKAGEAARNVCTGRMVRVLESIRSKRREALRVKIAAQVLAAKKGLYRISQSKWAGGEHTNRVQLGSPSAKGESYREWSSNGKWSGNSSTHTITVPETWLDAVAARNLEVCDGMLTLDAEPILGHGPELFAAAWVEQGKGFALNVERGYIARQDDTTYHARSARAALDGLARKLGQKPARRKGTLDLDRLARRHGDLPVELADSLAVGNCKSGTLSWCRAVGIDPHGTATVAEIVTGYKLRPLPEVISVLRRVVRDRRNRGPIETTMPESSLEAPTGRVVFDAEGGFRIVPSDN